MARLLDRRTVVSTDLTSGPGIPPGHGSQGDMSMAKPQKPPPTPAGAVTLTLTTAKTARALAPEELELAADLEKVA